MAIKERLAALERIVAAAVRAQADVGAALLRETERAARVDAEWGAGQSARHEVYTRDVENAEKHRAFAATHMERQTAAMERIARALEDMALAAATAAAGVS